MSNKRVLTDFAGFSKFSLNEGADGKCVIEGEFGKADTPTANGRIYPRHLWEREIKKVKPSMDEGTVFGHLNHPKDGKTDLKEVAMVMKDLWIERDGRVMGRAEICENQWGDQYKAIHKAGGKVGVSSRGMGSTKMGEGKYAGHEVVDEDYDYMTHDLVADPAVKTSYPEVKMEDIVQTKVEVQPKTEAIVEKKYTEEELNQKLTEQKEKFDQELLAKTSELTESFKKEKSPIVEATEKLQSLVESMKPAPTEEVKLKEVEISTLKTQVESMQKELDSKKSEIAELIDGAKSIAESAKRLGLALAYEREISGEDKAELSEEVGLISSYKEESQLMEAVKKAKKKIADKKKIKAEAKKKMEDVEAKHKADLQKLSEAAIAAKASADEVKKQLAESLKVQQKLSAKVYLEDCIRGNPNAQKIRKLCESMTEKINIDEVVKNFSIDESVIKEYNSVQTRINRVAIDEAAKPSTLVESQLDKERPKSVVAANDVDAEIAEVFR